MKLITIHQRRLRRFKTAERHTAYQVAVVWVLAEPWALTSLAAAAANPGDKDQTQSPTCKDMFFSFYIECIISGIRARWYFFLLLFCVYIVAN